MADKVLDYFTDRCSASVEVRRDTLVPCGLKLGHGGPHEPVKLGPQTTSDAPAASVSDVRALPSMSTPNRVKKIFRAGTSSEKCLLGQRAHKVGEIAVGKIGATERPGDTRMSPATTQEVASPMPNQRTARKYALTRIKTGDYVFPSNDGKTLWRAHSYEESGDGEWCIDGKWVPIVGTYWALLKYDPYGVIDLAKLPDDFLDWERWASWGSLFKTRQDAIDEALRLGEAC